MMPLAMAQTGEKVMVAKVSGSEDMKKHLEDLGFVPGAEVNVVSNTGGGNIIVLLKESRLALTSEMALKIKIS